MAMVKDGFLLYYPCSDIQNCQPKLPTFPSPQSFTPRYFTLSWLSLIKQISLVASQWPDLHIALNHLVSYNARYHKSWLTSTNLQDPDQINHIVCDIKTQSTVFNCIRKICLLKGERTLLIKKQRRRHNKSVATNNNNVKWVKYYKCLPEEICFQNIECYLKVTSSCTVTLLLQCFKNKLFYHMGCEKNIYAHNLNITSFKSPSIVCSNNKAYNQMSKYILRKKRYQQKIKSFYIYILCWQL